MCLRSDCGVCSDSSWQWNKSSGVLQLYRSSSTCVSRSESTRKFRILSNQWSWCLCWNPFPFFPCGMLTLGWRFLGFSGSEGGFDDHCLLYADMTGFELPKKVNVSWQIHWNPHFNYALIPEITIFSRNPLRLGRFQQWPWHRKRHRFVRTGTFPLVAAVYLGTSGRFVFLFCDSPFSMDRVSVVYRSELGDPYESPWKYPMRSGCKITVTETSDPSMGVERGSAEEVSVWPRRGPPVHWNHSRMHACYYWFRSFMITINSFFFMINPDGFVALLGSITVSVITSGVHHPSGTLAPSNVSNANMEKTRDKWQNGWLRIGHLTITTVFQQPLCGTNYGLFVHSFIYLRRKSFVY